MDFDFFKNSFNKINKIQTLDLATCFGCTGSINVPVRYRPCFGRVTEWSHGMMDNRYVIALLRKQNTHDVFYDENAALLSKEDMNTWLDYIKTIIPFEYEWVDKLKHASDADALQSAYERQYLKSEEDSDTSNEELEYNSDLLEICGLIVRISGPHLYHIFVLTMIRYLYSMSYEVLLAEAMRLKELPTFKNEDLLYLYNLVYTSIAALYSRHPDSYSTRCIYVNNDMGHVFEKKKLIAPFTTSMIRDRVMLALSECEDEHKPMDAEFSGRVINLNSLFPILTNSQQHEYRVISLGRIPQKNFGDLSVTDAKFWIENQDAWELRKIFYYHNHRILMAVRNDENIMNELMHRPLSNNRYSNYDGDDE